MGADEHANHQAESTGMDNRVPARGCEDESSRDAFNGDMCDRSKETVRVGDREQGPPPPLWVI